MGFPDDHAEMGMQRDDSVFAERRAVRALSVIVVGAGIGGLAIGLGLRKTGHNVGEEITEVGAGIQLPPNATRILRRFGVLEETMRHATVLDRTSLRRWENDEELGSIPLALGVEELFGAPLTVIHRADLQRILLNAAIGCGCEILKDQQVLDIDQQFLPYVILLLTQSSRYHVASHANLAVLVRSHGRDIWMSADLVIAADGMNSIVRRRMAAINGYPDQLIPAGESAYRFLLSRKLIQHDGAVMKLLSQNQAVRYMGPGGHIMAYPLRDNSLYNVVLVRVGDGTKAQNASWTTRGRKEEIIKHYRGWCPAVRGLVGHIPVAGLLETPMNTMPPLPTWVKGQVALAGDACHYMFPYVAQGAANAIEDAGTLAMAFTCTDQIGLALQVYQVVRKDRSEWIQASATNTGRNLHLPDGEEQRRRDETIRAASRGTGENPDQWSDRRSRDFMWRVDVMAETIATFESLAAEQG
ncbi:putative salicylate hydroxylase [Xylaria palmicola]|nr:putative salicylate hydroxylase [Xylaria palmicola]